MFKVSFKTYGFPNISRTTQREQLKRNFAYLLSFGAYCCVNFVVNIGGDVGGEDTYATDKKKATSFLKSTDNLKINSTLA